MMSWRTRRAQAIAEDRCFSKGRLRDEFRMKPAPGAEPVKWYKNSYGGRFAVYRIADCVPMREKRPLTSKQQLAGQRLSVLSRLNSTSGRMARQAYDWLSLAPLFLDTETTGLDNTAEALEIGLTDAAGQVVPRFYVSTSKSIIKALINMHSFEIQLSPIG